MALRLKQTKRVILYTHYETGCTLTEGKASATRATLVPREYTISGFLTPASIKHHHVADVCDFTTVVMVVVGRQARVRSGCEFLQLQLRRNMFMLEIALSGRRV